MEFSTIITKNLQDIIWSLNFLKQVLYHFSLGFQNLLGVLNNIGKVQKLTVMLREVLLPG